MTEALIADIHLKDGYLAVSSRHIVIRRLDKEPCHLLTLRLLCFKDPG